MFFVKHGGKYNHAEKKSFNEYCYSFEGKYIAQYETADFVLSLKFLLFSRQNNQLIDYLIKNISFN